MFKIAEELMAKIESMLSVNTPALAGGKEPNLMAACVRSCTGSCAGSCQGTCTGSCHRSSR